MGQALQSPGHNPMLAAHPKLTFQSGPYRYTVATKDGQSTYSVTDGQGTITEPVRWAFGQRTQTFVLERGGQFYETLVSYYDEIDALDITTGDQALQPHTLEEAVGRPLATSEITACFGCHSSNSIHEGKLALSTLETGITCQRCHSGASNHLQTLSDPKSSAAGVKAARPVRLGARPAEETAQFCGACHRTFETVVRNNWFGEMNVRFQPYRLASSKCYDGSDTRISCTACHNPHENVTTETKAYDSKCLACHANGNAPHVATASFRPTNSSLNSSKPGKACPVAQGNCAGCHMPQVKLTGTHKTFFDHNIRIVRPGEPYPN
jgi:hypothetical protein